MELYQLRTFAAVAELGSLARACDRLHLSQPAASGHIKALESELGVALFVREPKGLTLTLAGSTLLIPAQRMLGLAGELTMEARRLRGKLEGRLRFGAFLDPGLLRLGELMRVLVTRHPMLDIEVHHQTSRAVIAGVRAGELDAGIALCARRPEDLAGLALDTLRYRIVAPASWAERVRGADWNAIAALPWISTPAEGSHFHMAARIFEQHAFRPAKVIEADSEAVITSLVFAGLGLGLMRDDLAREAEASGKAVTLPNGEADAVLTLLHPKPRADDPAIKALIEVVRELWPGPGAAHVKSSAGDAGRPTQ